MEWQIEILSEIAEINTLFNKFCKKIAHEHHKGRDGVWNIRFNCWTDAYLILHDSYWLDDIFVEKTDLLLALKDFKIELESAINKAISEYDFKKHCGKEIIRK